MNPGMTCRDYRSALIELARGGVADPRLSLHAERCAECGRFLDDQVALTAMFRETLLTKDMMIDAPLQFEAHLLAEFDTVNRSVKPPKIFKARRWVPVLTGAIAASLAIAWLVTQKPAVKPAPVSARIPQHLPQAADSLPAPVSPKTARPRKTGMHPAKPLAEPEAPFLEIPYTIPLAPYERASVMRMEMPVAALIAAGLPVGTANAGGRAQADVVVGEDGRAHAVRVISISSNYSQGSNNQ